jgi:hypothetical protein
MVDSKEIIISVIAKNILYKRKDNFISHVYTFFKFDFKNWYGEINDNEFKIWSLSTLFGAIYPVIIGKLDLKDGDYKVKIKTKLNIFGKFLVLFWFSCLTIYLIIGNHLFDEQYKYGRPGDIFIGIGLWVLVYILFYFAYRDTRRRKIDAFKELFLNNNAL